MAADYKQKYQNLRTKFIEATDVAFRLGVETGMKEAQMQQMAQQAQQQAEQEAMMQQQMMQQGGEPQIDPETGEPIPQEGAPMEEGVPMEEGGEPQGGGMATELDEKIDELQSLVAKGEKPSILDMRKAVEGIADIRKSQKTRVSKKMERQVSAQKSFVNNLLTKWEEESTEVKGELGEILKQHSVEVKE